MLVGVNTAPDLSRLVMHTARRIRRARTEALSPYGLTPHQAGAFLAIARHRHHHPDGELRLSDLAKRMRIAPRSATEVVDALCELGVAERQPSATDRRATSLALTPAGESLIADIEKASPALDLFEALTPNERATLSNLLKKVVDSGY